MRQEPHRANRLRIRCRKRPNPHDFAVDSAHEISHILAGKRHITVNFTNPRFRHAKIIGEVHGSRPFPQYKRGLVNIPLPSRAIHQTL